MPNSTLVNFDFWRCRPLPWYVPNIHDSTRQNTFLFSFTQLVSRFCWIKQANWSRVATFYCIVLHLATHLKPKSTQLITLSRRYLIKLHLFLHLEVGIAVTIHIRKCEETSFTVCKRTSLWREYMYLHAIIIRIYPNPTCGLSTRNTSFAQQWA